MADRPVRGFRWKQHYENHRRLRRVLQTQLHFGLIIPSSYSFSATQSFSCLCREHVHYRLLLMPRPSNQVTYQAGRQLMRTAHCAFTVNRQICKYFICSQAFGEVWKIRGCSSASRAKQELKVHADAAHQCKRTALGLLGGPVQKNI